jgi:peptidoglycan/LPS O-acetylase OafA/YrhL
MLAATVLWTIFIAPEGLTRLWGEVLAAVAYVSNWFLIARDQSYFESFTRPSPLRHLWSLAIEEQFYLLWPLALCVLLRRCTRRVAALLAMTAAVASAVWMAVLYDPFHDPSRVYYGSDTRLSGLAIGSALALVFRPWESRTFRVRSSYRLSSFGLASIVMLAVIMTRVPRVRSVSLSWRLPDRRSSVRRRDRGHDGVAVVVEPATRLTVAALDRCRSYAIYLWHWPVIVFSRPDVDVPVHGFPLFAMRVSLTLLLADLTHRVVEGALSRATPCIGIETSDRSLLFTLAPFGNRGRTRHRDRRRGDGPRATARRTEHHRRRCQR